jgi:DNA adenine methylase
MKIACPRCGEQGYLTSVNVRGNYYLRVEHVVGGKKRVCYLGRDVDGLRRYIEEVLPAAGHKIIRFPGGDYHIADLLLPRLERLCQRPKCTFVEVFGGSGYMSQTVSRDVFNNIIYNDINNMLVALYNHIKERPERLATVLALLPYSRTLHNMIIELMRDSRELAGLVAAVMAFYAYNTSFSGTVHKRGFAYSVVRNEARTFKSRVASILKYAEAWRDVVIESLDFREAIRKYDSERTVFYLDPPYVYDAKEYYGTPFTADDLRDMATLLTQIRGRFLLKLDYKTYELIKDVLPDGKYVVELMKRTRHMKRVRGGQRDRWLLTLISSRV